MSNALERLKSIKWRNVLSIFAIAQFSVFDGYLIVIGNTGKQIFHVAPSIFRVDHVNKLKPFSESRANSLIAMEGLTVSRI